MHTASGAGASERTTIWKGPAMVTLKEKYLRMRVAEKHSDEMMKLAESEPENERLDAANDAAYTAWWDLLEEFAVEMERFTGGMVDAMTAKRMACCSKYSGRLEDLMKRWAA